MMADVLRESPMAKNQKQNGRQTMVTHFVYLNVHIFKRVQFYFHLNSMFTVVKM